MPIYFMTTALLIVSLVTNLTVEGIKKLLNETTIKYSSNVLAAVVAVLMSCAVCVIYLIMNDVAFTLKVGVEVCILMYLSFLTYITTKSGTAVSSTAKKSVDELAREVIQGLWGNGQDRKNRLQAAGYDYNAVQKRVNELL